MNDLTYSIIKSESCNFADDNTIYACSLNIDFVVSYLKVDTQNALCWFRDNEMVANPSKFQVMFLRLQPDQEYLSEIDKKPILATMDSKLKFSENVNTLCTKANNKTSVFSRVLDRILYNTFIMSNFNFCPLL